MLHLNSQRCLWFIGGFYVYEWKSTMSFSNERGPNQISLRSPQLLLSLGILFFNISSSTIYCWGVGGGFFLDETLNILCPVLSSSYECEIDEVSVELQKFGPIESFNTTGTVCVPLSLFSVKSPRVRKCTTKTPLSDWGFLQIAVRRG